MKVAWLFPGQGSQAVGMGKELALSSRAARAVYDQADEALGESLSRLCFEGPLEELTLTANTQPAILTTSVAVLAAVRERWPSLPAPECAAGHSLGEYSALVAAGVLSVADAARICRIRGRAMQAAVLPGAGAMAAVMGLDDALLEALLAEACAGGGVVCAANYNAPGQTVVAGDAATVTRAGELFKARGGKVIPLNVSAPFHSPLMASARRELSEALALVTLSSPAFDVLANVDAEPRPTAAGVYDSLVRQVDSPVLWVRTIERMRDRGVTHCLELGHGKVLAGLVKRIDKSLSVLSVSDQASIEKIAEHLGL
ncbi:MAG: [acyl-carrier-protein] S-malonyltransferase [Myxococcales bacterium]|nr:[acyl-carrier-protein] S-malonyltransferase [Myxococcales bacterium]